MEPITAASIFIAALSLLGKEVVKDAYTAAKNAISRRFGSGNEVEKSLDLLEVAPDSTARKALLGETIATTGIVQHEDVRAALEALAEAVQREGGTVTTVNQQVSGTGHIFSGTGDVTVNERTKR